MGRGFLMLIVAIGFTASLVGGMMQRPAATSDTAAPLVASHEPAVSSAAEGEPSFASNDQSVELRRGGNGHFYADVRINGALVHMLVDTGASGIALSRDDARSAGVATSIGMNEVVGVGADGAVHGDVVRLDRVELGPLSAQDMDAIVLSNGDQSLLGQSLLGRFASVRIEGDRMLLR
jgi:aspartyl protease family protein